MVVFRERLKERRRAAQLTQEALAESLGVSPKTVSHWEIGIREPSLATVQQIAHALDTSISYLVGDTDDPAPPPRVSAAHENVAPGTPHTPEEQLIIETAVRNAMRELAEHLRKARSDE